MRILQVHNVYQRHGGEDVVAAIEKTQLEDRGNEVELLTVSNDAIQGMAGQAITAWRTGYSRYGRALLRDTLARWPADIVHVHNFFPLLSPSIYDACQDAGVPVVQTLHNYRTICAGGLLQRGGKPCEDCIGGSPYRAVLHKCYRDSSLGSLVVARMVDTHHRRGTWSSKVDRFIALTDFAKGRFIAAGFPADKIAVKPNFVADPGAMDAGAVRSSAVFVGRISQEKGIATLLAAWRELDIPLRMLGEGPMAADVREAALPNVAPLGARDRESVYEEMQRAAFLVFPSICYEGFPMTFAEAFAHGLPVIASRLGAMAEIIEDGVTGLHFKPGDSDDLVLKVRWANSHPDEMRRMGANARRVYEEKYTSAVNYRQLMDIFERATEVSRRRRSLV